jgi:hypothetical protein
MIEPHGRRAVVLASVALVVIVAGVLLLAMRPERFDPLAPSSPVEAVQRTARLAGFETVTAGEDEGIASVRLTLSAVSSAADVEIAWQTGFAMLTVAFPQAREYVVRIEDRQQALLELRGAGEMVRTAVGAGDARALLDTAEKAYARYLPADKQPRTDPIAAHPAEYLDAKNRAAGLLGDEGPTVTAAADLVAAVESARAAVPGIPAPPAEADAGVAWAGVALALVREQTGFEGAAELAADLAAVEAPTGPQRVLELRALYLTAQALEPPAPFGSVLAATADACREVLDAPLAEGAASDAVVAATTPDDAPANATQLAEFERVDSLDVPAPYAGDSLPARAHAVAGEAGLNVSPAGKGRIRPAVWEAYRRADGTVFWFASAESVALTDASLRGWAFSVERAGLVDAGSAGVVLGYLPVK